MGFVYLGGLFVSFMSGNSTRLAVDAAHGSPAALVPAALIIAFVIGVATGALVARAAANWRKAAVLALVTALLLLAAISRDARITPMLMAAAMGSANNVFQREGEVSIGVTYMTGTLVKVGQHIANALAGGAPFLWVPYLLMWLGLFGGALLGALAYHEWRLDALWFAVAASGVLTVAALILRRSTAPLP